MNKWNSEQILTIIKNVLIGIGIAAVVLALLRIFWPLIVVALLYLAYKVIQNRRIAKEIEKANAEKMEKDLFYEQVRRKRDNAEIIDAEFTESKEDDR